MPIKPIQVFDTLNYPGSKCNWVYQTLAAYTLFGKRIEEMEADPLWVISEDKPILKFDKKTKLNYWYHDYMWKVSHLNIEYDGTIEDSLTEKLKDG